MKTVKLKDQCGASVPVFPGNLQQVHGLILKAHQQQDLGGIRWQEKVLVQGNSPDKTTTTQVEKVTRMLIIQGEEEYQEARQPQHKHQREVREGTHSTVQPKNAFLHIII